MLVKQFGFLFILISISLIASTLYVNHSNAGQTPPSRNDKISFLIGYTCDDKINRAFIDSNTPLTETLVKSIEKQLETIDAKTGKVECKNASVFSIYELENDYQPAKITLTQNSSKGEKS